MKCVCTVTRPRPALSSGRKPDNIFGAGWDGVGAESGSWEEDGAASACVGAGPGAVPARGEVSAREDSWRFHRRWKRLCELELGTEGDLVGSCGCLW